MNTKQQPVAADLTARTPQDFAIEHAEYMAAGVEHLLSEVNDLMQAGRSSREAAEQDVFEAASKVQSLVYEFRKRRDRTALSPPPPHAAASSTEPASERRHIGWCTQIHGKRHYIDGVQDPSDVLTDKQLDSLEKVYATPTPAVAVPAILTENAADLKRLIGSAVNYPKTPRSAAWVADVFAKIDALATTAPAAQPRADAAEAGQPQEAAGQAVGAWQCKKLLCSTEAHHPMCPHAAAVATPFSQSLVPVNYATFFYELATLMGIGAQNSSPEAVWREQMLPTLLKALAVDATTGHSRAVPMARQDIATPAWAENDTMKAIRATASYDNVRLTNEYGPYDISRPTFKCDRLVEAIIDLRDTQWRAALTGSLGDGGGKG